MNQQNLPPEALAAIQAAQGQRPPQEQKKPDNEFSVENFINFLSARLATENDIAIQNKLNIDNLTKILAALKAIV